MAKARRRGTGWGVAMSVSKSSLAMNNLRALAVLAVIAFHSASAYLGWLGPDPFPFDQSPYEWRAFPIVDSSRWFGFDVFCGWQDVYLMALMFFLSGLFTWPSLMRKRPRRFLSDRFLRLGAPYVFGMAVLIPIALYPAYRVRAVDASVAAYVRHFLALPFWPNGHIWFLWQLLVLASLAAALNRFVPRAVERLAELSSSADTRPGRYFIGLAGVAAVAYVPLALVFTPWTWVEHGPFGFQLSRPLLYAVFYLAGLGVGAHGLERGLLAADGMLARRWLVWFAVALISFLFWMGLTALTLNAARAPIALQVAADVSYAAAAAGCCFFALAGSLRFGARPVRILSNWAENAFGMYVLHYPFVVWLQYALLGVAFFALAKATIVIAGAVLLAWAMTVAMRSLPIASRLVGEERALWLRPIPSPAERAER
jgi:glucans biosynthesis protein C